jgi:hypothetical protein
MAPLLPLLAALSFPAAALPGLHNGGAAVRLRQAPACVLHAVAGRMAEQIGRHRGPAVEQALREAAQQPGLPVVRLESETTLQEFARDIAPQNPGAEVFSNFYAVAANKIFLIDEAAYYARLNRFIEDSLAHEWTHYLQARYLGYTVAQLGTDDAEMMAQDYQSWYREEHGRPGRPPAPCP